MTVEGGISYIALNIYLHRTKICSSNITTLLRPFSIIFFTGLYDQVVTTCKLQYVRISEHRFILWSNLWKRSIVTFLRVCRWYYGLNYKEQRKIEYLRVYLFPHPCRPTLGSTQPSIWWVPVSFPGVKGPMPSVDHPSPSSAEVIEKVKL
jgi:hypothetical protein